MADLTPELLAQLEGLLAGWEGTFSADPVEEKLDGWEGQTQLVWNTSPSAGSAFEDKVYLATDFNSDVAPDIVAMLNAVPALVAAAKERDQLRAAIERIKAFVSENAIINDFELEAVLKGEAP